MFALHAIMAILVKIALLYHAIQLTVKQAALFLTFAMLAMKDGVVNYVMCLIAQSQIVLLALRQTYAVHVQLDGRVCFAIK